MTATPTNSGRVESRHTAVARLLGRCPDCICDPVACATDDTGNSCLDCGYCLHREDGWLAEHRFDLTTALCLASNAVAEMAGSGEHDN